MPSLDGYTSDDLEDNDPADPNDAWINLGDTVRTAGLVIRAEIAAALRWIADGLDVLDR